MWSFYLLPCWCTTAGVEFISQSILFLSFFFFGVKIILASKRWVFFVQLSAVAAQSERNKGKRVGGTLVQTHLNCAGITKMEDEKKQREDKDKCMQLVQIG